MTLIMKTAFITGTSSGLGRGLAEHLVRQGWAVFGCSRRGCDLSGVHDQIVDLADHDAVPGALHLLLADVTSLDLVVLNAGILGEIGDLTKTPLEYVKQVMEVNVWAKKSVMDWLHDWSRPVGQVVMVSSGAAVLGNRGWSGYALSKAALNMLAKLYAHEFEHTHIAAVAPGIIDTAMMGYLCGEAAADAFPGLGRLREARGTDSMPRPLDAAARLVSVLPMLKSWPSGSFVDIREILEPEEYARLFKSKPLN
jgi:NAD(P)-dependent dehydrogenase (short-subunit alcohol dehydrogenase family)